MSEQMATPAESNAVQRAIDVLIAPEAGTEQPNAGGAALSPPPGAPDAAYSDKNAPSQAAKEPEAPKVKDEFKESLADLIRKQREERQARQAHQKEASDLKARVAELEGQLAKSAKADLLSDPIGFAQAHGLSEKEMALIGQAYLYHLVPDKAPPDLRVKLLEAKMAREKKLDEDKRTAEQRANDEAMQRAQVQQYTSAIRQSIPSFGDSFPHSTAWFGANHEEYTQSLVHTARNLAEWAQENNRVADLSPKAVAAVLEQDLASRFKRLKPPAQQQATQQQGEKPVIPAAGKQPAVLSTRGQGASPAPPAMSEEERLKRAMDVVFADR